LQAIFLIRAGSTTVLRTGAASNMPKKCKITREKKISIPQISIKEFPEMAEWFRSLTTEH
jgi:hypothetical protein